MSGFQVHVADQIHSRRLFGNHMYHGIRSVLGSQLTATLEVTLDFSWMSVGDTAVT